MITHTNGNWPLLVRKVLEDEGYSNIQLYDGYITFTLCHQSYISATMHTRATIQLERESNGGGYIIEYTEKWKRWTDEASTTETTYWETHVQQMVDLFNTIDQEKKSLLA